ncbi:hypothetical protein EJA71_00210 [Pseudomonas sp. PB106]|nr:hypothetical protein EJA71_00210 [Pseudomonas sp. PB106]
MVAWAQRKTAYCSGLTLIVPTLCVGMPLGTLRVPARGWDAERPRLYSHAERGNNQGVPSSRLGYS